ncbi:IS1634 family transposase, partial [Proteiniclasticum sp. BAD-10]|nr:IS1634 family transposase [Proteiniclasticum sediminis]
MKVTKNREGIQYVSIVEGYRDKDKVKHRTVKSLGKLTDLEAGNPNYLAELKESVKEGKFQPEPETLFLTLDLNQKISAPLQNYGWLLLDEVYKSLGIASVLSLHLKKTKSKIDLNEALRLLTVKRILDPQSKWKSVQTQGDLFGDFALSPQEIYRSLDTLSVLSEEIQLQMHHAIAKQIGRTGALVFYDVTNYYFETDLDDEPVE